tara:strand:- start:259 stop:870 length:612 start_codon:yes stop_codon:yes gene_type:complete
MNEKIVEWTLDDLSGELRRISLVSTPAVEEDFMLFSGNIESFKTIDEDKRVLTGVAMRPNVNIPRRDEDGSLYYGFFSEETVVKAAELYFKNNSNANNTNLEHKVEVGGVFVFESWIVTDPKLDKSLALGFTSAKKGDWFVSMKIENDVVWNEFLKTGFIRGFSVEVNPTVTEVSVLERMSAIVEDETLSDDEKINKLLKLTK